MITNFKKLKEFCLIGDGIHTSIKRQSSGVQYFTSKNFKPDGLDLSKVDYISESDYEKNFVGKSSLLKPISQDIVFGIIGSIGTPYLVRTKDRFGISSSVAILRSKENILPKYLYLYMNSNIFQSAVDVMKSGSAQGFLSLQMIGNLPITVPSLDRQKKIAGILATYDDLIDINKERINILERMATEIYTEWFVRFRFPNWQQSNFKKGMPTDWSEVSLNGLGKITTGKTPSLKVSAYHDGEYPFYKTPDMHDKVFVFDTEDSLTEYGLSSQKSQIIEENSIMVTCIGTGGVIAISTKKGCTNQQINSISLYDEDLLYWALFTIKRLKPQIELFGATGTTMTNLSKGKFSQLLVLKPTLRLIREYQNTVKPMFDQIKVLSLYNSNLIKQKKNLLPRLMSGKMSVDDLNVHYPPSMQTSSETEEK